MLRRVMDLRNVVDGGDAVVELREAADEFAGVDILRPVVAGEARRRRCQLSRTQDIEVIILLGARRAGAVVDQDAVGNRASDRGPGLMVMRVDETGHHDTAARIDHVDIAGVQVRTDRENLLAVDQYVAADEIGDRRVHRHHRTAADQIAPAGPAAVARRAIIVMRGRGPCGEEIGCCRGDAGRRRTFEEIAPRGGVVLPPSSIAQDAHVGRLPDGSFETMTACHSVTEHRSGISRVEMRDSATRSSWAGKMGLEFHPVFNHVRRKNAAGAGQVPRGVFQIEESLLCEVRSAWRSDAFERRPSYAPNTPFDAVISITCTSFGSSIRNSGSRSR